MDAKEIQNEKRNKQEFIVNSVRPRITQCRAQALHAIGRLERRHRLKTHTRTTLLISLGNDILRTLPMSANAVLRHVLAKVTVELQNRIRIHGDHVVRFVNDRQDISIPCDLFLVAIAWLGFLGHDGLQSRISCRNAFYAIGRSRRLNLGYLLQRLQHIWLGRDKKRLLATKLMNRRNQIAHLIGAQTIIKLGG